MDSKSQLPNMKVNIIVFYQIQYFDLVKVNVLSVRDNCVIGDVSFKVVVIRRSTTRNQFHVHFSSMCCCCGYMGHVIDSLDISC